MNSSHPRALRAHAGFSLLELLVVITIIGLLAALVGPRLLDRASNTKGETTKAQLNLLTTAVDQYQLDTGTVPTDEHGLDSLLEKKGDIPQWDGPYITRAKLPTDGWGRDFKYKRNERWGFIIYSLGADGAQGGTDDDADFNNRDLDQIP